MNARIDDDFIQLNRTFHELAHGKGEGDDVALTRSFGRDATLRWTDLLSSHRVILLSEAGSGKTREIRNVARTLRADGKAAFFVRIEHVAQDFPSAFEEGTFEEFDAWAASGEEGWLLLDSVDEARLRDPKDFERAVRILGRRLAKVLQRAHIVITGRTSAWRPKTDLLLCSSTLHFTLENSSADEDSSSDEMGSVATSEVESDGTLTNNFLMVALDDLYGDQIDTFVSGKGVANPRQFRDAIERKDAWSFTTRPQDLSDLAEFWIKHDRIGSRLELMQSSIARRLEERDQDRSEARPLTLEKTRLGAQLVAAATILTHDSAIRVPDGSENSKGISIKEVLADWDDVDCAALLSRPIFDEGIYGTVRFHHRSVREYLAAEWLHSLIVDHGSRLRIEGLFFRNQYGFDVIVPTMRPVLPWLAILDEKILARVRRLAPEVLFEGGDPSQLPRETRGSILRQACEQLAQPARGRSLTDYAAIQRFANADIVDDINELLNQYAEDDNITWFLLRMIWQGELAGGSKIAKQFAISSQSKYPKIAAIRAVTTVGTAQDQEEIRTAFVSGGGPLNRDWLSELIPTLPRTEDGAQWLLGALERTSGPEPYQVDGLGDAISAFTSDLPTSVLPIFISGMEQILAQKPIIEKRYCEISEKFSWLMKNAVEAAVRMIEAKHPSALDRSTLSIVRKIPAIRDHGDINLGDSHQKLLSLTRNWPEFSYALFWHDVSETRAILDVKKGERLTEFGRVGIFGRYWSFDVNSLHLILNDIEQKSSIDDKLIALSLGFSIYRENGRPHKLRLRLKALANISPELGAMLDRLLHPPRMEKRRWDRWETRQKRRLAREEAKKAANKLEWKKHLEEQIELLRNPGKADFISQAQYYLHERMREGKSPSNKWSEGSWRSLIPEFGEPIARAFRDGAVAFWRTHRPKLLSERADPKSTPFTAIFGLTGLAIEAREDPDWAGKLSASEAEVAARFAVRELNGFPVWLPAVYERFPDVVAEVFLQEIGYELATDRTESGSHYALYDASWHGSWMWDRLGPRLLVGLASSPKSVGNLRYALSIVQGSSIEDATIAKLARWKSKATKNPASAPMWFAVWVGVEPATAIPALAARLAEMENTDDQTMFAMRFLTSLLGDRRTVRNARELYRTVEHMKALYLLIHTYIRESDDIERAGKGVYSPGLRDDAQDARRILSSFIQETPGKEAFLALMEISRVHPDESSRPWVAFHAKAKATQDADLSPWRSSQVREFHDCLERTPSNHRDLWFLAVERLLDLKNDLEDGDSGIAVILQPVDQETQIRKFVGNWCRDRSNGRYIIPQEEELADAKRPDLRFHGSGFDGPVPVELKLADKWTGPHLFERLEMQLCGDYLRDRRSSHGIFLLFWHGTKASWDLPNGKRAENFQQLIDALDDHWSYLSTQFSHVEEVKVIGIDLTKRANRVRKRDGKKASN